MKIIDFFRSKIILFIIQISILSLSILYFQYKFYIDFDSGVTISQKRIIQFIANYVLFNDISGLFFIYVIWVIVSFIPIFLYNDFKRAYSMNLMTFFFPNFFVFTFFYNYSENYFNANFPSHFFHSLFLGLILVAISVGISFLLKSIRRTKPEKRMEDLQFVASQIKSICPNCGTEFNSIPKYCYKCNTNLIIEQEENV